MVDTTKLGLPILAASQAQKHVTMNESLYRLDTLVQLSVLDKDLTAPPGSPTEGDAHIIGASATGAWSGHDGKVAAFTTGIWFFHVPKAGWLSWVDDEDTYYSYDGTDWVEFESGGGTVTLPSDATFNTIELGTTPVGGYTLAANFGTANSSFDPKRGLMVTGGSATGSSRHFGGVHWWADDSSFTEPKHLASIVAEAEQTFSNDTTKATSLRLYSVNNEDILDSWFFINIRGDGQFKKGLGVGGAIPDTTNKFSVNTTAALFNHDGASIRLTLNKNATANDATLTFQNGFSTKAQMGLAANDDFTLKVGLSFTTAISVDESTGKVLMPETPSLTQFTEQIGGAFLLDPNEHSGWSTRGIYDEVLTNDLGNVGANYLRTAGGLMFPFDVKILRFKAKHYNTNATALAWGWRIGYHTYTGGSNTIATTNLLQEVADNGGVGPRDYLSTVTQETDIDMEANGWVIPAGAVITLGVEAPTAQASNYYVSVMAGFMLFERVNN